MPLHFPCINKGMGGIPSPFDCYLMLRSLKTLPLRMHQHFTNALKIAHFLETHPCALSVRHPGIDELK